MPTMRMVSPTCEVDEEFQEIIDRDFPALEGRQWPEVLISAEGGFRHHGDKAIELARRMGVRLMPWQREQVHRAMLVDAADRWLHQDIVLICPRQNGKSLILEVIILYRLLVLHQQIVFTAQQWKTAKSIRNRLWGRIKSRKWAERRLLRNTASAGEAEMETVDGGKLRFTTRSNDAGRGFDEIDLLLLDEAYNLEDGELDAMAPIQLAAKDPQTYYTSTAVNEAKHAKGLMLSMTRARALAGQTEGLLYSDFRAPEGADPEDPETWRLANPSYGVIATEKKLRSLKKKLTAVGFEVEVLGWGRWYAATGDGLSGVVDLEEWGAARCDEPVVVGDSCLGVDVDPSGKKVGMVAALRTAGGVHLSAAPLDVFDRSAVVSGCVSAVSKNDPLAVVMDSKGPASTLADPLLKEGIEPEALTWSRVSAACELLMQLVAEGSVTHDGDPRWAEAWAAVEFRNGVGAGRAFKHVTPSVALVVAASFAVWGLVEFEIPDVAPEVKRKRKFVGHAEVVPAVPVLARGGPAVEAGVHEMAF